MIYSQLAGTLQKVEVKVVSNKDNRLGGGVLGDGTKVAVAGGILTPGEYVVRFPVKPYTQFGFPVVNVITRETKDYPGPLKDDKYVLVGNWVDDMRPQESIPTINQIERYFNPRDMKFYVFLDNDSEGRESQSYVFKTRQEHSQINPAKAIRRFASIGVNSRVVLSTDTSLLERFIEGVSGQDIIPVMMQRLDKLHEY